MLAGLVALSVVTGLIASGFAVALSLPIWVVIAMYPATGIACLMLAAAVWSYQDVRARGGRGTDAFDSHADA